MLYPFSAVRPNQLCLHLRWADFDTWSTWLSPHSCEPYHRYSIYSSRVVRNKCVFSVCLFTMTELVVGSCSYCGVAWYKGFQTLYARWRPLRSFFTLIERFLLRLQCAIPKPFGSSSYTKMVRLCPPNTARSALIPTDIRSSILCLSSR